MVKEFTLNDVVAYLYDDLNTSDVKAMQSVLHARPDFKASCGALQEGKQALPQIACTPSTDTIRRILLYSSINNSATCN